MNTGAAEEQVQRGVINAKAKTKTKNKAKAKTKVKPNRDDARPQWNVCFPATERGIPPYNADTDRAKRDAERKRALRYKAKCAANAPREMHSNLENNGKKSSGHVQLDVGRKTMASDGVSRKRASISLQIVHDEAKGIEMNVVKRILERESLLTLLKDQTGPNDSAEFSRKTCIKLLLDIRQASLLAIEAISKWRHCLPEPLPFIFENRNYLLRVLVDLGSFDSHASFRAAVAKHFHYDPVTFRLRGNPFLFPVSDESGQVCVPFQSEVPHELHHKDNEDSNMALSYSKDPQDTSHIGDLATRRMIAAWAILVQEHERATQRLAERQVAHEEIKGGISANAKQEIPDGTLGTRPQSSKDARTRGRLNSSALRANRLAPLGAASRQAKTLSVEPHAQGRACLCDQPVPAFTVSEVLTNPNALPPLTQADLHAFRSDSRSKLERMDADIAASQKVVDTLETAVAQVQDRLRAHEKKLRRPTPRLPPEIEALRNKFQRLSKSLHYRRIELQRKHLARHCFVQDQAMRVDLAVQAQVKRELREPLQSRDPALELSETLDDPDAAATLRLVARNTVEGSLDVAVTSSVRARAARSRSGVARKTVGAACMDGVLHIAQERLSDIHARIRHQFACTFVEESVQMALRSAEDHIGLVASAFVASVLDSAQQRLLAAHVDS